MENQEKEKKRKRKERDQSDEESQKTKRRDPLLSNKQVENALKKEKTNSNVNDDEFFEQIAELRDVLSKQESTSSQKMESLLKIEELQSEKRKETRDHFQNPKIELKKRNSEFEAEKKFFQDDLEKSLRKQNEKKQEKRTKITNETKSSSSSNTKEEDVDSESEEFKTVHKGKKTISTNNEQARTKTNDAKKSSSISSKQETLIVSSDSDVEERERAELKKILKSETKNHKTKRRRITHEQANNEMLIDAKELNPNMSEYIKIPTDEDQSKPIEFTENPIVSTQDRKTSSDHQKSTSSKQNNSKTPFKVPIEYHYRDPVEKQKEKIAWVDPHFQNNNNDNREGSQEFQQRTSEDDDFSQIKESKKANDENPPNDQEIFVEDDKERDHQQQAAVVGKTSIFQIHPQVKEQFKMGLDGLYRTKDETALQVQLKNVYFGPFDFAWITDRFRKRPPRSQIPEQRNEYLNKIASSLEYVTRTKEDEYLRTPERDEYPCVNDVNCEGMKMASEIQGIPRILVEFPDEREIKKRSDNPDQRSHFRRMCVMCRRVLAQRVFVTLRASSETAKNADYIPYANITDKVGQYHSSQTFKSTSTQNQVIFGPVVLHVRHWYKQVPIFDGSNQITGYRWLQKGYLPVDDGGNDKKDGPFFP